MAEPSLRNFTINFGPQHPAAHGVLRLVLELDGEVNASKDGKVSVSYQNWEASKVVLEGEVFEVSWGPQGVEGRKRVP